MDKVILGIESSCDDTSAGIVRGTKLLANVTANQEIHRSYGGVVPELASRAHQQNIVPVVHAALSEANITPKQLDAIAFTSGPGLLGSLLVGTSFAKSLALALQKPLVAVHHMEAHILAHFIARPDAEPPPFPFLCLTVSGGHTQLVVVRDHLRFELIGQTLDDAAGEAFDKAAKIMGLPYPGGPLIDRHARQGDAARYTFSRARVPGLDFSFSGLKTNVLYFLQEQVKQNPRFVEDHLADLCASIQQAILDALLEKLELAAQRYDLRHIALAGGVAANSGLRQALQQREQRLGWHTYIPALEFCTDNGAMIAIAGYYKWRAGQLAGMDSVAQARRPLIQAPS